MPNSSALTPQYTQAHTAEQFCNATYPVPSCLPESSSCKPFLFTGGITGLQNATCELCPADLRHSTSSQRNGFAGRRRESRKYRAGKQTSLKMIPSQTLILQTHTGLMLSTWTVPDDFSRATHMLTVQSICQIRAFMANCKIKGKSPSSINCNELLLAAQFKIAAGQIPGRPLGIKWCGLVATEPGNTFSWINCLASRMKH